jgi:hypothetical protein
MDDVLPRSIYRRPGSRSQDISVSRNFRLTERTRLQVRAEFYNALNHANLELATGQTTQGFDVNNPLFAGNTVPGVVARYGSTPRQVVMAARIQF